MLKEYSIIDERKVVVIGGFKNFRRNLEKRFSNIKTIDTEAVHMNMSFIKNYDLVVFVSSYANHTMWQKVMKVVNKKNLLILNRQHNLDIMANKMEEKLLSKT